ncbi:hypothetical protein HDU67_003591, partial [Dinochytrium kinnereticum]
FGEALGFGGTGRGTGIGGVGEGVGGVGGVEEAVGFESVLGYSEDVRKREGAAWDDFVKRLEVLEALDGLEGTGMVY